MFGSNEKVGIVHVILNTYPLYPPYANQLLARTRNSLSYQKGSCRRPATSSEANNEMIRRQKSKHSPQRDRDSVYTRDGRTDERRSASPPFFPAAKPIHQSIYYK